MVTTRKAVLSDAEIIAKIFKSATGRSADKYLSEYITKFPSVVALDDGEMIAFCYSKSFAPDIIELRNIFVVENKRRVGIGKIVISEFEEISKKEYDAIILVNSIKYKSKIKKKFAENFYLACDYDEIMSTHASKIYWKKLSGKI